MFVFVCACMDVRIYVNTILNIHIYMYAYKIHTNTYPHSCFLCRTAQSCQTLISPVIECCALFSSICFHSKPEKKNTPPHSTPTLCSVSPPDRTPQARSVQAVVSGKYLKCQELIKG